MMEQEERQQKGQSENQQETDQSMQLENALKELHRFVLELTERAGEGAEYGEQLWQGIRQSGGLLQELAYYHDYGSFLSKYQVAGYTLSDALIWQVDHFKLYMDRPQDMNRYRQEKLLLSAFETLLQMEKDPTTLAEKMRRETGQDIQPGM
ncbi:MAG: hypothetical protein J1E01_07895 [Acetatifactor sp.]|nr:hypothetical protein [Acetatifactor sp.]